MLRACAQRVENDRGTVVNQNEDQRKRSAPAGAVHEEIKPIALLEDQNHEARVCELYNLRSCDETRSVSSAGSSSFKALDRALQLARMREVRQ